MRIPRADIIRQMQWTAARGADLVCRLSIGALVFVGAIVANAQTVSDERGEVERAAAVAAARSGDFAGALAELARLQAVDPDNEPLLFDRIVVAGWAEADAQVLDLGLPVGAAKAPPLVQTAVGKAARNLQRFDVAVEWYSQAVADRPADVDARLGLLLAYADKGDRDGVTATLTTFRSAELSQPNVQLARGYALRSTDAGLQALAAYDAVLATAPNHPEALRGKALTLRSVLLPTQALELARSHPGILSDAEMARLEVDEIAVSTRLAARTPYPESVAGDNGAAMVQALDALAVLASDETMRRTLLFDRVVALADANRGAEAIATFESVPDSVRVAQPYVLRAAGNAYLQEQRPEDAERVLEAGLAQSPSDLDLRFGLVYAELDQQNFDTAFGLTADLLRDVPVTNQLPGSAVAKGNDDYMRAQLIAGVAEAYGDQLAVAQSRFEALLAAAPNNPYVRQELANVYRWRGWLDRALFEYAQVLSLDESLLSARIGYANARFDARDYPTVAATVDELTAVRPNEPAVVRLAERWQIHNLSELDVVASSGNSSGTTFGSEYYTVDARWFTRPKHYRYRGFVHLHEGFAAFPEGDARRQRVGFGAEYRALRWAANGELTASRSGDAEVGIGGRIDWRLTDRWLLGSVLELDSDAVPLRGHRVGVEADQIGATARFALHEGAGLGFGWTHLDLSDDNTQDTLFADGRYRFVNKPNWKLDATGSVATSWAATEDVPYFSPERDFTIWGGLAHEQRLYRRYEHSLTQIIALRVGRHDQSGFDAGSIWSVGYDLDWRLSDTLGFGLGLSRAAQFFDGLREYANSAQLSMNGRF